MKKVNLNLNADRTAIHEMLAKELGISYYDREILRLASDDSGINLGLFMIKTSIKNLPYKKENDMLWVEDFCSTCGVCIDRCPENAFDEDGKVKRKVCTAHKEGCSKCVLLCPFFKRGYDKVKKRYDRNNAQIRWCGTCCSSSRSLKKNSSYRYW